MPSLSIYEALRAPGERGIALLRGLAGGAPPAAVALRRKLWEESGVLADTVSTSVLKLSLRPVADGPRKRALRDAADRGDPVHLAPWDLRRVDVTLGRGRVLVVENPSVLESFAVRHGGRFAVVCTAGWPAAVAVGLLDRLAVPLAYHGDIDWRGPRSAAGSSNVEACSPGGCRQLMTWLRPAAGGSRVDEAGTPWDPAVAAAMHERGLAVHEEQVVDALLDEWSGASSARRRHSRRAPS